MAQSRGSENDELKCCVPQLTNLALSDIQKSMEEFNSCRHEFRALRTTGQEISTSIISILRHIFTCRSNHIPLWLEQPTLFGRYDVAVLRIGRSCPKTCAKRARCTSVLQKYAPKGRNVLATRTVSCKYCTKGNVYINCLNPFLRSALLPTHNLTLNDLNTSSTSSILKYSYFTHT